jgi:hypothetical protein
VLNIQFGRWQSILQRDYIAKNISVYGINILLRVIELPEKKGYSSAVFERVEVKTCVPNIQLGGRTSILQSD